MNGQLNIMHAISPYTLIFLRKIRHVNFGYYTAYSEGHNGSRSGPVDREDGIAKTSLSNNFSLRVLGMSPGSFVWL